MWILFSFEGSISSAKTTLKCREGRWCLQRNCDQLLQKILPSCARFAWHGFLSLSLRSLNYLDNEEARKGTVLLFKSSKTKFLTVRLGLKRLMREKIRPYQKAKENTMLLMELAVQPSGNFGYTCKGSGNSLGHKGKIPACCLHREKILEIISRKNDREKTVTNLFLPGALRLTADFALGSSETSGSNGERTRRNRRRVGGCSTEAGCHRGWMPLRLLSHTSIHRPVLFTTASHVLLQCSEQRDKLETL